MAWTGAVFGVYWACWGAWLVGWTRHKARPPLRDMITGLGRIRAVQRHWDRAMLAGGLKGVDGTGRAPAARGWSVLPGGGVGMRVSVGRAGHSVGDLDRAVASRRLNAVFGCREITCREIHPSVAWVECHWGDPLARVHRLPDLPGVPTNRVAFGRTTDGQPATIMADVSCLIVGLSGSGKSRLLWTMLASLLAQGTPTRVHAIDPAGGVELHALGANLNPASTGRFAVVDYCGDRTQAEALIDRLYSAYTARLANMARRGQVTHKPTPTEPLHVLLIDELLFLPKPLREAQESKLLLLIIGGRKASMPVWAASQAGQIDAIGRIRDYFPNRICLATRSADMTDAALGPQSESSGAACSRIPLSHRGVGYAAIEGQRSFQRFRGILITDKEEKAIARGEIPEGMAQPVLAEPTAVYRWFDATDQLLYVGMSYNPAQRIDQHSEDGKSWVEEIHHSTVEWHDTREAAAEAEKRAIETEHPKYNIAHAGKRSRRKLTV